MSTIEETIQRYEDVCKESSEKPHPLVTTVLEKEKELQTRFLYLAGNNKLITDSRLTDKDAEILQKTLKDNSYVTGVDLRYNNFTDDGAVHIGKMIEESLRLVDMNIMCNDFGEEGAKHIAKALHRNESLRNLRLNGNKVGNKGGMYFAQALQINTVLESLDLGDTDLKTECIIALSTVLTSNNTLKSLNVNRPVLFSHQEETTVHFSKLLKVNRSLQELHLQKYDMRDFGVTRLADTLQDNFTLTHLDLSCNRLTRDGAKELAKVLKLNTSLRVLDLGFNRLGDDGARHLADALATYNTNLTHLVLVSNEICGKGLCAIADAMKMNTTLTNVYIWGNTLEESACIAFSNLLDFGRLEKQNTDVAPYEVDNVIYLSETSHGINRWYYWGPCYGDQKLPQLAAYT